MILTQQKLFITQYVTRQSLASQWVDSQLVDTQLLNSQLVASQLVESCLVISQSVDRIIMLLCIQIWSDLFILELERQKEQIFSFWNIQFCNWMTLKNYDKYNNTCFPSVYYYIFTFHFSTIFRFDSWWTDDCFKFQVSRMSGTPSKTSLSTISRLDPWRTGVPDAPSGGW